MEAMNYEYLIRCVNNCGRHGVKGADADIYRRMDMAERNLTNPHWNKSSEEKEYDYRSKFSEVRRYVHDAIKKGINEVGYKLSSNEEQDLKAILSKLTYSFYDKKELDILVNHADEIFRKHGLEAR